MTKSKQKQIVFTVLTVVCAALDRLYILPMMAYFAYQAEQFFSGISFLTRFDLSYAGCIDTMLSRDPVYITAFLVFELFGYRIVNGRDFVAEHINWLKKERVRDEMHRKPSEGSGNDRRN